ncbi:M20/M25/M40 family metallo-hydrolase [Bosea sp. (in: a-proteobacteria)]|uniref:M20 family metallopeptidase n=1 Tax=Bosea sp. (in: a-proteobacteria) TaxID=1871050 RepID=UPI002609C4C1|nr:M20/M25/M40 family metallo-hydrolase [Bosea sp. (in: a-proteobacteria)]MCO5089776.1 M20/M25/M40 family metallo-hydrolase [Bosea sp. (in: a-proteobacteria)]
MNARDLIHCVDEAACLALLCDWVRHKSYTETDGEKALVHHVVKQMSAMGIAAEAQPFDEGRRANAIGRWQGIGGGKSLLFNGHLDTNPATEGWTVDPWGGLVDDRFIYGIGVSNMKAGDAASYCAVKTLRDAGVRLKGDVILTYVVGELQGGVGTVAAIRNGVRADYFVNSEPTDLQAVTMHACSFMYEIELFGDTRHLSKREEAVDAVMAACDLVPRLNAMTFSGAPSAEHESINRMHVGIIHAALGKELHEWRPPQVADYCRIKGSGRFAPGQTQEGAASDVKRELAALERRFPGLRTSFRITKREGHQSMPAFEVAKDARIIRAINAAYESVRGCEQPTGAIKPPGFFGTDAGHLYAEAGMEGVVCGPGGKYNTMPDERVEISEFLDMIRIYMLTIIDICELA